MNDQLIHLGLVSLVGVASLLGRFALVLLEREQDRLEAEQEKQWKEIIELGKMVVRVEERLAAKKK